MDQVESDSQLNLNHQTGVAEALSKLAVQALHTTTFSTETFVPRKRVVVALMNKARKSFEAIRVLCAHKMVGDARALIRSLTEVIVNGAYISHVGGDEAAADYIDFVDYWDWICYTELKAVDARMTKVFANDKEPELIKQRFDKVKDRFEGRKAGEWCRDNLFKRASILDSSVLEDAGLFRILVNAIWRQASAYTHGSTRSVGLHVNHLNPFELTQDTADEAARTLMIANTLMFAWFVCFHEYLEYREEELENLWNTFANEDGTQQWKPRS